MKILFEHQHLYYLPQFEPMINVLKARGHNGLFGSICESVPDIEKNVFQENMARLGLKTIQANFEPQRCRILKDEKFDLIFIDPPYSYFDEKTVNGIIRTALKLLVSNGIVVCEHPKKEEIKIDVKFHRVKEYKDKYITFCWSN